MSVRQDIIKVLEEVKKLRNENDELKKEIECKERIILDLLALIIGTQDSKLLSQANKVMEDIQYCERAALNKALS